MSSKLENRWSYQLKNSITIDNFNFKILRKFEVVVCNLKLEIIWWSNFQSIFYVIISNLSTKFGIHWTTWSENFLLKIQCCNKSENLDVFFYCETREINWLWIIFAACNLNLTQNPLQGYPSRSRGYLRNGKEQMPLPQKHSTRLRHRTRERDDIRRQTSANAFTPLWTRRRNLPSLVSYTRTG